MSNNYHETVIIPTLQKKISELQNSNLVFEVSLLVEQAKMKDLSAKIKEDVDTTEKIKAEMDSKIARITSLKTELGQKNDEKNELHRQVQDLEAKIAREVSIKNNILGEYNILKGKYDTLEIELKTLKSQNDNILIESEMAKTSINKKKQ